MEKFLKQFNAPVFITNEERDEHEKNQDLFIEAICVEHYLKIIKVENNGMFVQLSDEGRKFLRDN